MTPSPEQQAQIVSAAIKQLSQEGRYDEALALAGQVCEAARSAVGERSFPYATLLAKMADLYRLKGDLPNAEKVYRQTIDILQATAEPNHPLLGEELNGLGLILQAAQRPEEAEQYLKQGTEIFKNAFGEHSAYYAFALSNLAGLYASQDRYAQAIATYEQLLAIQRQLPGQPTASLGERLTRLGTLYYELARYQEAVKVFLEASEVALRLYGENHLNYASSLSSLALQHKMLGEWKLAEDLYHHAIDVAKATVGEDDPYYATYIGNLSTLYLDQGRYREAVPLMRQVSEIFKRHLGENDPRYATSLNNQGVMFLAMGQPGQAETLFRQALEVDRQIYGEGHPQMLEDYMNLATVLMQTQRQEEAARYLGQANAAIKAFDPDHPAAARVLSALSKGLLQTGQFRQAEAYAVMAEEIWRRAAGPNHPNYADALVDMGWVARAKGQFEDAERVAGRALAIYRSTGSEAHEGLTSALRLLIGVSAASGRLEAARAYFQELAEADDLWISRVFSVGTEAQRLSAAASIQSDLFLSVSLALVDQAVVPGAFHMVLRRKAIGAEAVAAQREAILGGRYPALKPQFQELQALAMQIGQKTLAGPGPEGLETHKQLLAEWTARKDSLEGDLVLQIPELDLEQKLRAADGQAVAQALPDGSALVEFLQCDVLNFKAIPARGEAYWQPARYLAFVLPAGEPDHVHMLDLGEAELMDRRIAEFRASFSGGDRQMRLGQPIVAPRPDVGTDLRGALFDPLLSALGGRQRLFLAPDADLTRLPFEVLPTDDGRHLIDAYGISYVSVGRDLLRFGAKPAVQPAPEIVAADPDFDLAGDGAPPDAEENGSRGRQSRDLDSVAPRFERLPGTRVEGEHLAKLLGVQPLVDRNVLENRLKNSPSPRLLHIATHGFFLENQKHDPNQEQFGLGRLSHALESPLLRSGLALAGANTWLEKQPLPPEAEDGILTAEDVSGLDLLGTELVVLSACETGLGAIQVGEGVFGLRRAFVLAGAQTLITSLWKVPDQQTQELMEDFYRRILNGEPRMDALRAAQLALKEKYPDPLYWGAFICQGDPGPLPGKGSH